MNAPIYYLLLVLFITLPPPPNLAYKYHSSFVNSSHLPRKKLDILKRKIERRNILELSLGGGGGARLGGKEGGCFQLHPSS